MDAQLESKLRRAIVNTLLLKLRGVALAEGIAKVDLDVETGKPVVVLTGYGTDPEQRFDLEILMAEHTSVEGVA